MLLFNICKNNYILLSSNKYNESSKLYEFQENTKFIKNIYGTNGNNTLYMIPWKYKDNYYIIECCCNKISINNINKEECYANLSNRPESYHPCAFLYKDNYLCVSDNSNKIIRVWDLINKVIKKKIHYDIAYGYEIMQWNKTYSILGTLGCFIIFNIEEEKIVKKVLSDDSKHSLHGVKKIQIRNLGECLICADSSNGIKLYSL